MVIVEGPDGSGKSTLIRHINEHLGDNALPIAPRVVSKDTESMIPSLKAWVEDNVSRGFQATIFDRHRLISEPIYGTVLRSHFEPGFDDFQWLYLQNYQLFNRCKPVVIYCLPPYKLVKRNVELDQGNQPKDVREGIRKIYSLYVSRAASDAALYGALVYDYTSPVGYRETIFRAVDKAIKEAVTNV